MRTKKKERRIQNVTQNNDKRAFTPLRFKKNFKVQTWCGKAVHLHTEVILQEEEADDGEEINEKEGQNGSQNDGASVSRHTLDHIEQGLLSDHQVKQLSTTIPSGVYEAALLLGDTTE